MMNEDAASVRLQKNIELPLAVRIVGLVTLAVSIFTFLFWSIFLFGFAWPLYNYNGPGDIGTNSGVPPDLYYPLAISAGFFVAAIGVRKMKHWAIVLYVILIVATLLWFSAVQH